ncbi:eukaryotic translation initiation factor 3 subunit G-domain-containing protein [Dipodascopsis tothii]|uniref:eukaryotic translation initiation factor 3 subunit G-domain-containing protein n=1 Tax=Dipodascopsis tothii TaxID=44089 RepID=UPI0034CEBC56
MPEILSSKSTTNWADDDDSDGFPAPLVTLNPDGTKTVISYGVNPETGKKVKITKKIKMTVVKERVNANVAERKRWAKFGLEKGTKPGPDDTTTSMGENMTFKLMPAWKESKEEKEETANPAEEVKFKGIVCRRCSGTHYTSKCPFKDKLPVREVRGSGAGTPIPESMESPLGMGPSKYIAPHLRGGARPEPGMYRDRDDSATIRVSSLSADATEDDLRLLFERFGRIARLFLSRDRETGRTKGYAFISYDEISAAAAAVERMDGYGFDNLILRVEFSKRT